MPLHLPSVAEVAAQRPRAQPKGPSRLDVKVEKVATADHAWEACKRAVDKRDGPVCRICGKKTVVTLELDPKRAEHAHIVRRSKEKALKFDARNVFKACLRCHQQFDKREIDVVQKADDKFELNGRQFIDAYKPMLFTKPDGKELKRRTN